MNLSKRRKNHHDSYKAGIIYCDSSYEIKAALILDADPSVITYVSHTGFITSTGKKRIFDYLVTTTNGKKIVEVKPFRRLDEFKEQLDDNKQYASDNGYGFEIWTEKELGFANEHDATKWADHYLSSINKTDYVAARKELNRQKANRHYQNKIAQDKIEVYCEFCQETHNPLKLTYEKNIARNGRYICEREGGKMAGSKPKLALRKVNPYAEQGLKQCTKCTKILPYDHFQFDKSRSDGYCNKCKECRKRNA